MNNLLKIITIIKPAIVFKHRRVLLISLIFIFPFIIYLCWPPSNPFPSNYSRILYDAKGELLQATLASDQQLRFPLSIDSLPEKYIRAVLTWEDRRFFSHPGVDILSIAKSFILNIQKNDRVRGASTITMQTVRLAHPGKRTYLRKILECITSLKYSLHFSKQKILKMYAAHVPMGGNTVGIESASYRYYGTPLKEITWSQAALLAVLPNAPSMINIEHQRGQLKKKRDLLLSQLLTRHYIDSLTYRTACTEELPEPQSRIPFKTPHFTQFAYSSCKATVIHSTLDYSMQFHAESIMRSFMAHLNSEGIRNCAVLISDTKTGAVKVYIGSQSFFDTVSSGQVDGVQALRSSGSTLKPFLVAKALDRGPFTMKTQIHDVPTWYGNFAPMNADQQFRGLVTMEEMLIQSLNIPAVRLLHAYGVSDFYTFLKDQAGISSLTRTAEGYGLSLILGGAEVSLWDLCALYRTLGNSGKYTHLYFDTPQQESHQIFSRGAAWLTLEALRNVKRPEVEYYRQYFTEQLPVAWKTGTSYGQKDAWAIGVNAQWTIGVWVGNFNGEGNQLLGGSRSAGPLLFSLFRNFTDSKTTTWFEKPEIDLKKIEICSESGLLPNEYCPQRERIEIPECSYTTKLCSMHKHICMGKSSGYEVCSRCWDTPDTIWTVKTILDPAVVSIYKKSGRNFDVLPLHNPQCKMVSSHSTIEIEYPLDDHTIQIPRNYKGEYEKLVLKANYQRPSGHLFWYLNTVFIGETIDNHSIAVNLESNDYVLTVQDEEGATAEVRFMVFRK
jgi:penicillin-binding protein 1C